MLQSSVRLCIRMSRFVNANIYLSHSWRNDHEYLSHQTGTHRMMETSSKVGQVLMSMWVRYSLTFTRLAWMIMANIYVRYKSINLGVWRKASYYKKNVNYACPLPVYTSLRTAFMFKLQHICFRRMLAHMYRDEEQQNRILNKEKKVLYII